MKKLFVVMLVGIFVSYSVFCFSASIHHHKYKTHKVHKHVTKSESETKADNDNNGDNEKDKKKDESEKVCFSGIRNFFYNLGSFSGTFDITSNYVFRGLSQSNNNPAYQGGLTYTFSKFGLYIATWGSNVFFPAGTHETATLELDMVVGDANKFNDHFSYDVSFVRYYYPKAPSAQYNEFINKFYFTYNPFTFIAEISYSYNVLNSGRSGTYYNGELDFRIPAKYFFTLDNVTLSGWFGHYSLPGRSFGLGSYNDFEAGISKKYGNYTVSIQWVGTNGGFHGGTIDDKRIIGTILVVF